MSFIVLEGIDGSGKTTQAEKAAAFLFGRSKFTNVLLTREPTSQFRIIREKMSQETDCHKDVDWYTRMFVMDRINHVTTTILPALETSTYVVCDRYKPSTLAYQWAQGQSLDYLISLHEKMVVPDITFILTCSVEVAKERRGKSGELDVFERDVEFAERCAQNYLEIARILQERGENVVLIDANGSEDEVFAEIQKHLEKLS